MSIGRSGIYLALAPHRRARKSSGLSRVSLWKAKREHGMRAERAGHPSHLCMGWTRSAFQGERVRGKKRSVRDLQGAALLVNMTEALLLLALLEQAGGGQNQETVDACYGGRELVHGIF